VTFTKVNMNISWPDMLCILCCWESWFDTENCCWTDDQLCGASWAAFVY